MSHTIHPLPPKPKNKAPMPVSEIAKNLAQLNKRKSQFPGDINDITRIEFTWGEACGTFRSGEILGQLCVSDCNSNAEGSKFHHCVQSCKCSKDSKQYRTYQLDPCCAFRHYHPPIFDPPLQNPVFGILIASGGEFSDIRCYDSEGKLAAHWMPKAL